MPRHVFFPAIGIFIFAFLATFPSMAQDRHSGYYYPAPASSETYTSSLRPLPTASRRTRIGFTVGLSAQQRKLAYAPTHHVFAKGASAEKMIIVATGAGGYDTLFRLRALLAELSSQARNTQLFRRSPNPENLNFLDLAKLAGFVKVTLSDGATFAHTIDIR